jgi:hypothetical protein
MSNLRHERAGAAASAPAANVGSAAARYDAAARGPARGAPNAPAGAPRTQAAAHASAPAPTHHHPVSLQQPLCHLAHRMQQREQHQGARHRRAEEAAPDQRLQRSAWRGAAFSAWARLGDAGLARTGM